MVVNSILGFESYFAEAESPFKLQYAQGEIDQKNITKRREYISGNYLTSFGTPEQTRFMRRVYEIHRKHAATKRKFVDSLPSTMLDVVIQGKAKEGLIMRKDAALACRLLLRKAQDELALQKQKRLGSSMKVKKIGILSGYRSADKQFSNWRKFFENKYYPNTQKLRSQKVGGEHGEAAANFLAIYIGKRLGSPGYSYHNNGLAVDFFTVENGTMLGANTDPTNISRWRKSWFFNWLFKYANGFGFYQNTKIVEPWHWEYKPGYSINKKSSLPLSYKQIVSQEIENVNTEQETEYVNIDLKIDEIIRKTSAKTSKTSAKTGIYMPPKFIRGSKANIIVYLHGHKKGFPEAAAAIDTYWDAKRFPFFALREKLRASNKNAILVAPTLGPGSQGGYLITKGLDWYLEQILAFLQRRGIANAIGEVILACHSGGGHPMLMLALSKCKTKVTEYWGFDCLYSGYSKDKLPRTKLFTQPNKWIQWAKKNPSKRLYIYYHNSTKLESQQLMRNRINHKLNNIIVEKSDAKSMYTKMLGRPKKVFIDAHYWVPIMHWQHRLSQLSWS